MAAPEVFPVSAQVRHRQQKQVLGAMLEQFSHSQVQQQQFSTAQVLPPTPQLQLHSSQAQSQPQFQQPQQSQGPYSQSMGMMGMGMSLGPGQISSPFSAFTSTTSSGTEITGPIPGIQALSNKIRKKRDPVPLGFEETAGQQPGHDQTSAEMDFQSSQQHQQPQPHPQQQQAFPQTLPSQRPQQQQQQQQPAQRPAKVLKQKVFKTEMTTMPSAPAPFPPALLFCLCVAALAFYDFVSTVCVFVVVPLVMQWTRTFCNVEPTNLLYRTCEEAERFGLVVVNYGKAMEAAMTLLLLGGSVLLARRCTVKRQVYI